MNFLPLPQAQILENMARLAYFRDWHPAQLARLAPHARQFVIEKQQPLIRKGAHADALYVVVSGQLRLFIPLTSGGERVVALIGQGESFAESCLVLNEPCPFEVVACKDSHVLSIDALIFRQELQQSPSLTERMLRIVSTRLLTTLRDVETCAQRSSMQRVACFLLQHRPAPDAEVFEIKLSARKLDIAAKLGLTQETFSRMLGMLGKQGLIRVRGSLIQVRDAGQLARINANAADPGQTPLGQ
jgi:CRP-like cAMP-binding protein